MVGQGAGAGRSQGVLISSSLGMKVAGRQQKFQAGVQDIKISGIFPSTPPPHGPRSFLCFSVPSGHFPMEICDTGPQNTKACVFIFPDRS